MKQRTRQRTAGGVAIPDAWVLKRERIVLKGALGQGNQGTVYDAELLNGNGQPTQVAVKLLKGDNFTQPQQMNEIFLMQKATILCDHVCKLLGICEDREGILMVMKKYDMNLRQLCDASGGSLPPVSCCKYAIEICEAMESLHAQNVVAMDLKPQNILWERSSDGVFVSDLGTSRQMDFK